jgi:hypothetical protein
VRELLNGLLGERGEKPFGKPELAAWPVSISVNRDEDSAKDGVRWMGFWFFQRAWFGFCCGGRQGPIEAGTCIE